MKLSCTLLLLLILSAIVPKDSLSQTYKINTYAGYTFDDAIIYGASNKYDGLLKGGLIWGGGFEYVPNRSDFGVELMYLRQDTESPVTSQSSDSAGNQTLDIGMNYILFGANKYFRFGRSKTFYSYTGAMLGVSLIDTKSSQTEKSKSSTNFAWGLRIGAIYLVSENVGLNFNAQLLSTTQSVEDEFFSGSSVSTSGNASTLQFGLVGGISLLFGNL